MVADVAVAVRIAPFPDLLPQLPGIGAAFLPALVEVGLVGVGLGGGCTSLVLLLDGAQGTFGDPPQVRDDFWRSDEGVVQAQGGDAEGQVLAGVHGRA